MKAFFLCWNLCARPSSPAMLQILQNDSAALFPLAVRLVEALVFRELATLRLVRRPNPVPGRLACIPTLPVAPVRLLCASINRIEACLHGLTGQVRRRSIEAVVQQESRIPRHQPIETMKEKPAQVGGGRKLAHVFDIALPASSDVVPMVLCSEGW